MSWTAPGSETRGQARREAVAWAAAVLANPGSLFIDTETTGLDGSSEIIDIAIVDGAGERLFESLVRPDGRIPPDATRIHGIVDGMVTGAPRWPEVYPLVERLLTGRQIIVYNADFDYRLFNQMNARHGFPGLDVRWECAMKQYGNWAGEWNAKYGNYRWHKLDVALGTFGYPATSHRALDDARACRLVVRGMAGNALS